MNAPLNAMYDAKPDAYFSGAAEQIVDALPQHPGAAILEIGCGTGATGSLALAGGKCGRFVGLEIDARAASLARDRLTEVVVGDIATIDLARFHGQFDALIASEVLEHLVDPWAALRKLRACLKPGARVFASSPNVAHRYVIGELIRGRFDYTADGVMDRTHLRWYTPSTFKRLFEETGFTVERVGPLVAPGLKARLLDSLTGRRLSHLFTAQLFLRGLA